MNDLTTGSIPRHIIRMAIPMAAGMFFQTLYYLIDLWFVAKLGDAAVAGVTSAGTVQFIIMALTQVLGVGTMVLISHAAGRKDRADASLVFNQSLGLSVVMFLVTLAGGYALMGMYVRTVGADVETAQQGATYLRWFLPALALQFGFISMGSALRGAGMAKPGMIVQIVTVLCNAVLAPVLIAGWGTGRPLGVAGAGLASTISVALGVVMLMIYFRRTETFVALDAGQLRPRLDVWGRLFRIGVPAGAEFGLLFLNTAIVYWIIRGFGPAAQAGYGIGSRVMQSMFLPAMAIAFSAAPVAGQNIGAGRKDRAEETFLSAVKMGSVLMMLLTLVCHWQPSALIGLFSGEAEVVATGTEFLRTISWNFLASGITFTCSGMFQALGNTVPSMITGVTRLLVFAVPGVWLSRQPGFTLPRLWMLSVAATTLIAVVSVLLLRRAFRQVAPRPVTPPLADVPAGG